MRSRSAAPLRASPAVDVLPLFCRSAFLLLRMSMLQHDHVASLKERLSHPEASVRRAAVRGLVSAGGTQAGVTTAVLALISDPDEPTRHWAGTALGQVVWPDPSELDDLIALLRQTSDGEVEYWTATMLGRLGVVAARAAGLLASVLLDSACLAARERAAWALAEIGPAARSSLNALRQIGEDDPPRLQRLAQLAMESMGRQVA